MNDETKKKNKKKKIRIGKSNKNKKIYMVSGVGAAALRADVTALLVGSVFFLAGRAVAGATATSSASTYNRRWRRFLRACNFREKRYQMAGEKQLHLIIHPASFPVCVVAAHFFHNGLVESNQIT